MQTAYVLQSTHLILSRGSTAGNCFSFFGEAKSRAPRAHTRYKRQLCNLLRPAPLGTYFFKILGSYAYNTCRACVVQSLDPHQSSVPFLLSVRWPKPWASAGKARGGSLVAKSRRMDVLYFRANVEFVEFSLFTTRQKERSTSRRAEGKREGGGGARKDGSISYIAAVRPATT